MLPRSMKAIDWLATQCILCLREGHFGPCFNGTKACLYSKRLGRTRIYGGVKSLIPSNICLREANYG